MTTREKFEKMLEERGMFPEQAKAVMKKAIPIVDYAFTWDSPANEYPEPIYNVVFETSIKEIALDWIEDNIPMAWYRPMFE